MEKEKTEGLFAVETSKEAATVFKSKLLNKYFDKWEDLVAEEAAYMKAHDEELKVKEEKKKALEEIKEAHKKYLETVELRNKEVKETYEKWLELKSQFANKYGGYHETYHTEDGKNEYTFTDLLNDIEEVMKTFPEWMKY